MKKQQASFRASTLGNSSEAVVANESPVGPANESPIGPLKCKGEELESMDHFDPRIKVFTGLDQL